jgi:dihydrofolate synthase/folylpolyglutamate synthase
MTARIEGLVARLHGLHPRLIDLSLERLLALLEKLGAPQTRLPPVIHVAGTNGKGSTCAFIRAIAEAAGLRVHVYTSPHLVRFNERIRLAGTLVSDELLADTLERVEAVNAGAAITVFEVITAVALELFARTPADLTVLEVGLGGRGDATNVIDRPAACAITSISLDHREMLGNRITEIAAEKAGIIKPRVPVVTGAQPAEVRDVLAAAAHAHAAPLLARDTDWTIARSNTGLRYTDTAGALDLSPPALAGDHQTDNLGIAVAVLRAAGLALPEPAFAAGAARAVWPARMQRLRGALATRLPPSWEVWLDGGHNPGAGIALAAHIAQLRAAAPGPVHVLAGMKQSKDCAAFLDPLLAAADTVWAVREPDQHQAMEVDALIAASAGRARPGPTVAAALDAIAADAPRTGRVLICGSLYLAGEVLRADAVTDPAALPA